MAFYCCGKGKSLLKVTRSPIQKEALKMSFSFKGNEISIQMIKAAEWFLDEYMGFAGGYIDNQV